MQVVENRIELVKKLGDLNITEKSELASLAECLPVSKYTVVLCKIIFEMNRLWILIC